MAIPGRMATLLVGALVVTAVAVLAWGLWNGLVYGDALGARHAARRVAPLIEALHAYRADQGLAPGETTALIPKYLATGVRHDDTHAWDGWQYRPSGGSFMLYRRALAYRYDEGQGPRWVMGLHDDGRPPVELDIPVGLDVERGAAGDAVTGESGGPR